jgi:hypothetical protein
MATGLAADRWISRGLRRDTSQRHHGHDQAGLTAAVPFKAVSNNYTSYLEKARVFKSPEGGFQAESFVNEDVVRLI